MSLPYAIFRNAILHVPPLSFHSFCVCKGFRVNKDFRMIHRLVEKSFIRQTITRLQQSDITLVFGLIRSFIIASKVSLSLLFRTTSSIIFSYLLWRHVLSFTWNLLHWIAWLLNHCSKTVKHFQRMCLFGRSYKPTLELFSFRVFNIVLSTPKQPLMLNNVESGIAEFLPLFLVFLLLKMNKLN